MINRENTNTARRSHSSHETDFSQISTSSSRRPASNEININDDLIIALSNAYENQRALQVNEWESIRRQMVEHAA